jgi:hypothetical protein
MEGLKKFDFLTQKECDIIVHEILSLESAVKRLGPDIYPKTSEDSLTGRYQYFNYLNIHSIKNIICPKLKELFGPCVVQCWANIFRQGEGIGEHRHIYNQSANIALTASGNIFLYGDPTIGTYYEGVKHDNKIGELSLFPSTMLHSVPQNTTGDMRISMAIDVHTGDQNLLNTLVYRMPNRFVYIR